MAKAEKKPQKSGIKDRTWQNVKLTERLSALQPDEIVTYASLGAVIGVEDVRTKVHYLQSARRRVLASHGIVTEAVENVGIKRVVRGGVVKVADKSLRAARRKAKQTVKMIECGISAADWKAMPPESRIDAFQQRTLASHMIQESGRAARSRYALVAQKLPELPTWAQQTTSQEDDHE